jgi:hypothetical protein
MRGILRDAGYELVAPDVCVRVGESRLPFEDWWVDGGLVSASNAAEVAAQIRSQWNAEA